MQAAKILAKYHGRGNPDSESVKLQLMEYEEHLEMDRADKRWWDYRALFKNRASFYRLMCNSLVSLFGQSAGNGSFDHRMTKTIPSPSSTSDPHHAEHGRTEQSRSVPS